MLARRDHSLLVTQIDPLPDDPHLLLRESAWLNRLARSLCGDRELAEDLSQEAMLAAWQSRTRILGPIRPWLAGVVRHLAANRRRAEARRQRRESVVAEPGWTPPVDEVVARANMHQSVVTVVMALEEPYRTALLLRYYDDLSCREIATRLGEPVETVRTRVKRGIGILRTRLDGRHGTRAAWLGPLSAMAEFTTTGVGIGALTLGSLVLAMNLKIASVLIAVTLAIVLWPKGASPPPAHAGAPTVANMPAAAVAGSHEEGARAPLDRERVAVATSVTAVLGRVLFARDDSPAVDVEVQLFAQPAATIEAGTGQPIELPVRAPILARSACDTDGRFRIALEVSQPFLCVVRVTGMFPFTSQVPHVPLGTEIDLGTIHLHDAIELHGRVRDTQGQPVTELELAFMWRGEARHLAEWRPEAGAGQSAISGADGSFRLASPVRGGEHWIHLGDPAFQLTKDTFDVSREAAFLDVVVERDLGTIRGIVTDSDGKPEPGLAVNSADGHCYSTTDAAGHFELQRRRGTEKQVRLKIWRSRFARSELLHDTTETHAWGADNVRVVLAPGGDLRLQIVQAPSMQPVEVFDLDMQREDAATWVPGGVPQQSGASGDRHENGVIELPGMVPGRYRILVVRPDHSVVVPFEVFAGERREQLVLPAHASLGVELVDAADRPVAGGRCDVFARHAEQRPDATLELQPKHGGRTGGTTGLPWPREFVRIAGGTSGADGTLKLPIPVQGEVWLRVFTEHHAPQLLPVASVNGGALRVVLEDGATLKGRVQPESLVRSLRHAYLCLRSLAGPSRVYPERYPAIDDNSSAIRADGTFELRSVPAGDWEVCLGYMAPGRGGARIFQLVAIDQVIGLESGQIRTFALECAPIAPVPASGTALVDGIPARFGRLDFSGVGASGSKLWGSMDCDADGRFHGELAPGTYDVEMSVLDARTRENRRYSVAGQVVLAGRPCELTLDMEPMRR